MATKKVIVAALLLALPMLCILSNGAAEQAAMAKNEPSRQPVLRIETEIHTEDIINIAVDAG